MYEVLKPCFSSSPCRFIVPSRAMSVVPRAGPVKLHAARFDRIQLLLVSFVHRARPGAEYSDIAEHTGIVVGRQKRMPAAHGESGDCAVILIRNHAICLFDERDHVFDQALRVRAGIRLRRPGLRRAGVRLLPRPATAEARELERPDAPGVGPYA